MGLMMLCNPLVSAYGCANCADGIRVVLAAQINVVCNGTKGVFHLSDMKISCLCSACEQAPANKRIFTPTQFEQHGGCGTAKKWRISIRCGCRVDRFISGTVILAASAPAEGTAA